MASGARLGCNSFDVDVNGVLVHFESAKIDITDNTVAVFNAGRPAGYVLGDVAASGELVLDVREFKKLALIAAGCGSWQGMPAFDITALGGLPGSVEFSKITAYGCKIKISSLLDADPKKVEKATRNLPFDITGGDGFVDIDGVPYADGGSLLKALAGALGGMAGSAIGGMF